MDEARVTWGRRNSEIVQRCGAGGFNDSLLQQTTGISDYIFIGRLIGAGTVMDEKLLHKVLVRRNLKGDLRCGFISYLKYDRDLKCLKLRENLFGIFFGSKTANDSDVILLNMLRFTLVNLDRTAAIVKGK